MTDQLHRTTFRTSREMDFFSPKELVTQTGHAVREWPLVIVKELIDNSMDACEEAGVTPVIAVVADSAGISVSDNGPGLPESTLQAQLDFKIRASNREAYVSPCRGSQGNALKSLIAMPNVIDQKNGKVIVEANGKRHVITCGVDQISQRPIINDAIADLRKSKNRASRAGTKKQAFSGTTIRLEWTPAEADTWPFDGLDLRETCHSNFAADFRHIVEGFALFNPHLTITLDWFGKKTTWQATEKAWKKWLPSDLTSALWYALPHFERLIGAYITHDREHKTDRLVSDFVSEFDGLSGSAKRTKVLDTAGLKRAKLSDLVVGDRLDSDRIAALLSAMQSCSRPVKSQRLGIIGEEHFRQRLLDIGCLPESFRYSRRLEKVKNARSQSVEKASFLPWVLESAFGYLGSEAPDARMIFAGANWSAAIKNPFRSFGATSEGLEAELNRLHVGAHEPIIFVLHLAHPRVEYTDRGKSALIVGKQEENVV
jgi:DNA topoisomerase VI subunit B